MQQMNPWLVSIPLAYLLGSIPSWYLLVRIFPQRKTFAPLAAATSGATNVIRSGR